MRAAKITAIDAGAPARLSTDLAQWHAQGPSEARIRRQLAAEDVDAAVADRLVRADQAGADWHARYAAHARERDRLTAVPGLSAADRAARVARVAQLRRQTFHASNEALRAQALDGSPRHE
ncbi:lipase secretion chaperone [Ralstonia pseudosolanacearum]|uniref:Lipase helper protein n=1 Tax=Ralstonia solanacearum TaxID=305 RepID=A0A0S4WJR3_RALSL|nr:lipase secretion chaperone [Ralstonia pseudosolanacearum]CUV46919.1 putative lipase chaperone protein [Ralstonia solanacearum]MDO3523636.1 lipase secretion chaperone [Ralstonia pseudosolanacearum]MDO3547724.1 lipase secretion chaperone [Ralstonia pseudosolanacearum]MDO3552998.1 lipase secretion chaperone [Ralstonia pseudosolanacearum]MDO3568285.1 lipase secretion chaperone [Ralstonia pseudosolanacearum]